jgi:hypothetical protein
MADEIRVDKKKFDALLGKMIASEPQSFKEVVAKPKPRRDGGVKRSAKRRSTKG